MYRKILVALENGPADETMLPQIAQLAARLGSELLLLHVADGWAARSFDQLKLAESEEIKNDREYLEKTAAGLRAEKLTVTIRLAMGNPPTEILKIAEAEHCNLIAMTSHGHRFFGDLFHGSTITEVRHRTHIPIFLVRAEKM
ncbi:MAG: universal stress protein [Verrucomicrobiales bacterium]|nr:universal stress protein [Verrucomicrobiales bacterium]